MPVMSGAERRHIVLKKLNLDAKEIARSMIQKKWKLNVLLNLQYRNMWLKELQLNCPCPWKLFPKVEIETAWLFVIKDVKAKHLVKKKDQHLKQSG